MAVDTTPVLVLVAASTAPTAVKNVAEYVCDGTADQTEINNAVTAANAAGGGLVQLTPGTFVCSGPVQMRRKVVLAGSQYSATTLQASGTWSAYDASSPGAVIEPLDDHQDRVTVKDLTIDGNQGGSANVKGFYANINTTTGFVYGDDSRWLVENLFIYQTRATAFEVKGAYLREWTGRTIRVFDCGIPGTSTAHGFVLEGQDSTWEDCNAGSCTGEGFWVPGVNHRFTDCKAWFCDGNGWRLTGVRNKLASCESQDNLKNGYALETNDLTLTSCLADSNSYDGSPSGSITGRTYHGFWLNAGGITIVGGLARDKNEGSRGIRQLHGYYLESGCLVSQVIGLAFNHFTAAVGGPGVDGTFNNIQVTGDQSSAFINFVRFVGSAMGSEVTFWRSEQTAAVANQGLDLPSALTELDSGVLGTRKLVEALDIGASVQVTTTIRNLQATSATVVVSVRDTSNTANVLATVSCALSAAVGTQSFKSTYAAKPSWLTGDKTLAVYTSGGNGTLDFIFKDVTLRHRP